jgi:hypothetical protein
MKMKCPFCGVNGSVSDSLLGKKVKCPKCKEIFKVTAVAAPHPSPEMESWKEPKNDSIIETSGHVSDAAPSQGMTAKDEADLEDEIAKIFSDMKKSAPDQAPDPWQDSGLLDQDMTALDGTATGETKDGDSLNDEDMQSELENILGENCSMCGGPVGKATKHDLDGKVYCSACLPEGEGSAGEVSSSKDLAVSGAAPQKASKSESDWEGNAAILAAIGIIAVILSAAIFIILK